MNSISICLRNKISKLLCKVFDTISVVDITVGSIWMISDFFTEFLMPILYNSRFLLASIWHSISVIYTLYIIFSLYHQVRVQGLLVRGQHRALASDSQVGPRVNSLVSMNVRSFAFSFYFYCYDFLRFTLYHGYLNLNTKFCLVIWAREWK